MCFIASPSSIMFSYFVCLFLFPFSVFHFLTVLVWLSIPLQVIDWRDSSPE